LLTERPVIGSWAVPPPFLSPEKAGPSLSAKDGVVVHLENGLADFLVVQRSYAPDSLDENLAAAVASSGEHGEIGVGESFR